jgi:hypothetical protein
MQVADPPSLLIKGQSTDMEDITTNPEAVYEAPVIESLLESSDIEREIFYAGFASVILT